MKTCFAALIVSVCIATVSASSIYFVGNSLSDGVDYNKLTTYAQGNGEDHLYGRHMIPGAPLDWNWDHPDACISQPPFGCYPTALGDYTWDAISLQPFDRTLDSDKAAAQNFINLAKGKSPSVQIFIYGRWPNASRGNFSEWFDKTYTGGWDGTNETRDYLEKLTNAVRSANPSMKPALILPISEVMYELDKRMKAGEIPGYNNIYQVYTDGWHMNSVGSFICGATVYATLYKKTPVGKTVSGYTVDAATAEKIADAVWDVVSTYAYSGVSGQVAVSAPLRQQVVSGARESDAAFDIAGRRLGMKALQQKSYGVTIGRQGLLAPGR